MTGFIVYRDEDLWRRVVIDWQSSVLLCSSSLMILS